MHVLLTGHTGFKGAWFIVMLKALGHDVSGVSLNPLSGSLFSRAELSDMLTRDFREDVRDKEALANCVSVIQPDFVVHFAAQALVKESYREPEFTFETNVNGTLNLLAVTQEMSHLEGRLIITSDKVYLNDGRGSGYIESDALGGRDPYSASKAMADILTQSWIHSFRGPVTAIARAGNVIGGGDVSPHRLLPDAVRAAHSRSALVLRYPSAVRPWQHVLDCLSGYLSIMDFMKRDTSTVGWNVGPDQKHIAPVRDVVRIFGNLGDLDLSIVESTESHEHEEQLLTLDSSLLREKTGWRDKLGLEETLRWTADWEKRVQDGSDPRTVTERQVDDYFNLTHEGR